MEMASALGGMKRSFGAHVRQLTSLIGGKGQEPGSAVGFDEDVAQIVFLDEFLVTQSISRLRREIVFRSKGVVIVIEYLSACPAIGYKGLSKTFDFVRFKPCLPEVGTVDCPTAASNKPIFTDNRPYRGRPAKLSEENHQSDDGSDNEQQSLVQFH
jgi:hypothetical protein